MASTGTRTALAGRRGWRRSRRCSAPSRRRARGRRRATARRGRWRATGRTVCTPSRATSWTTPAVLSSHITFEVDAVAPSGQLSVVCGGVISCVGGIAYATQTTIPLALSATDAHNVTTYALGNGATGNAAQSDAWDGGTPVVS